MGSMSGSLPTPTHHINTATVEGLPVWDETALRDYARAAVEAALAAAPQWVSCAERLPEAGVEVLVWLAAPVIKYGCQIAIDTWDEQHETPVAWSSATIPIGEGWDSGADWQDITHWMPLPAAPGGEE